MREKIGNIVMTKSVNYLIYSEHAFKVLTPLVIFSTALLDFYEMPVDTC